MRSVPLASFPPRLISLALLAAVAGGACTGVVGDPGASPGAPPRTVTPPEATFTPAPAVLPRLTAAQYRNTLEDILGEALPSTPVEPDTNPYLFFNIGATSTALSELGTQRYAEAAATVTDTIFADPARRDALLGCTPESVGDACIESFVSSMGRRLFRRPLSADEATRWMTVARDLAEGDAYAGARLALYGMLQSPSFLYRVELGEPDPRLPTGTGTGTTTATPAHLRYTNYEMASRLAFLFWNTGPDEALLAAAERGELVTDDGIYEQAMRLGESPRTRRAVMDFFAQYLDLARLDQVARDVARYPAFTDTLAQSMKSELRLVVDDFVFRRDADVRGLFDTRHTFVNAELAALYGVDAPGASSIAFVPVDLPAEGPRAGILTLGAFLTMNAHQTETSPTLRGKYVRERILCQSVPPPPENVDIDIAPSGETPRTLRERLEQHRRDPACASCHSFIDPPGMLFERFDSIGVFRTEVEGLPLDTTGNLDGTPLDDARGLATMLRDDPRVPHCMVTQLYRHANGRLEAESEAPAIDALTDAFAASGYRFRDLLVELAMSESFRTLAPTPTEVSP